jgi:hypothetical protein
MADDLVSQQHTRLVGKTRCQIRELLGPPDVATEAAWEYEVDLGEDFFGAPWMYQVRIAFDDKGRAAEALLLD